MSKSVADFIHKVTSASPSLGALYQETVDYWAPDGPPAIVVLGDLGRRMVDDMDSSDGAVNAYLFDAIEEALQQGDMELKTAVATGMIEAMVGRSWRNGVWEDVLALFGELSAIHARAWASK